ncbi:hypothetical protein CDCA_CDCA07G2282 [Cyanidium caldarium]|uniref:Citrate synthase n=1 Tax=Cyanidium caldarium TaxID=2771 RepID=A0AAV9IVH3_CYACA|nr:hypothetical protein CDCA_CDCA07G2282 [Cyanidium caldarium]
MERYRLPGAYLQVRCSEAQVNKRVALYSNRAGDEAYTNDDEDRRSFVVCVPAAQCPLRVYDPQMYHTAVCASRVTFPDGVHGKLYYRGYDVEELVASAAGASFEEVAFLLINGELPDAAALAQWRELLLSHTFLHEDILAQLRTIRHDAHPMGSLISAVSALSTFHPEANPALRGASLYAESEEARNKQVYRLLGKVATIAACVWRAKIGRSFVPPCTVYGEGDNSERNAVSYVGNFLRMLDGFVPHAALVSIVERAWIVLADDGLNCATGALRHVASSGADPYVCVGTAMAAMYGERISGVGKAVIRMLEELHAHVQHARLPSAEAERDCIAAYVDARYKRPRRRLQGFGHVNYKQYDPRARVLKQLCLEACQLFEDPEPLLQRALQLEEVVLGDAWFAVRRVWPNVDLYLPLLLRLVGLPLEFYAVFVAVPRTAGWVAHWLEGLDDGDTRIYRPRQIYVGESEREYVGMEERVEVGGGGRTGVLPDSPSASGNRREMLAANRALSRMVRSVSVYQRRSTLAEQNEEDQPFCCQRHSRGRAAKAAPPAT